MLTKPLKSLYLKQISQAYLNNHNDFPQLRSSLRNYSKIASHYKTRADKFYNYAEFLKSGSTENPSFAEASNELKKFARKIEVKVTEMNRLIKEIPLVKEQNFLTKLLFNVSKR